MHTASRPAGPGCGWGVGHCRVRGVQASRSARWAPCCGWTPCSCARTSTCASCWRRALPGAVGAVVGADKSEAWRLDTVLSVDIHARVHTLHQLPPQAAGRGPGWQRLWPHTAGTCAQEAGNSGINLITEKVRRAPQGRSPRAPHLRACLPAGHRRGQPLLAPQRWAERPLLSCAVQEGTFDLPCTRARCVG